MEADLLVGDATKAHEKLGWKPVCDLKSLVDDMMKNDLAQMNKEKFLNVNGYGNL